MRFGAMNNPWEPVSEQVDTFARMGFDYVDLTIEEPGTSPHRTDWPEIRHRIQNAGLGVVAHTGPYLPIANLSLRVREAAYAELRACVDVASFLGARICTMHFCAWPSEMPFAEGVAMYEEELGALVAYGREKSVAVAMENSPFNQHQLKSFREIMHRLPSLKLLYDISHGNIQTPKSMTREYLFELRDRLVHVHLSDNDGRGDDHLPPGAPRKGGLNVTAELQMLHNFRYDETVTLEIYGQRMWLKASLDFVRQLTLDL